MFQQPAIKRRKRDPVFTTSEKMNLIDLVEKHYSIIECKKIDSVSNRNKVSEWEQIAIEFNASTTHIEREVPALRNLWDNLKKKAKAMIVMNENRYGTGGNPLKDTKDDPVIDIVISMIKNNAEGFQSNYDSDTQSGSSEIKMENEDHDYDSQPPQVHNNGDPSSYTTADLRTSEPSVLIEELVDHVVTIQEYEEHSPNNSSISGISANLNIKEKEIPGVPTNKPFRAKRFLTNRRRPLCMESEAASLAHSKINTLKITTAHAQEEHEVTMRLLKIQEEQEVQRLKQEREKTEQEKIKTEILREQLRQLQDKTSR